MPSGLMLEPPREKNSCSLGQRVEVEQHLLAGQGRLVGGAVLGGHRRRPVVRVEDRDAAAGAVLPALEGAPVVPPAAVAGGHREVGLLGAGPDLPRRSARAARPGGRCAASGPGVLRHEVRQHLGGVLLAQPLVVVGPGAAVDLRAGEDGARMRADGSRGGEACPDPAVASGGSLTSSHVGRAAGRTRRWSTSTPTSVRRSPTTTALLEVVTSANVACGYHAGTAAIMRAVCARGGAARRLRRRAGLLRRPGGLRSARAGGGPRRAARAGGRPGRDPERDRGAAGTGVRYLKPHGALYHRTLDDPEQARGGAAGSGCSRCWGWPASCCARRRRGRGRHARGLPRPGVRRRRLAAAAGRARGAVDDEGRVIAAGPSTGRVGGRLAVRARRQPRRGRARAP